MRFCLLAMFIGFAANAVAQNMVVTKVKGNTALVKFSGAPLTVGQRISASGDDGMTTSSGSGDSSRKTIIGVSGEFYSEKTSVSASGVSATNTSNLLTLTGRYGWNAETMEYGFIAALGNSDNGSGSTLSYGGGGFFDYNFQPNRPGQQMIWAVGGLAEYLLASPPNGATGSSTIRLFPSGVFNWFPLGTSTGLRLDFGYEYDQTSQGQTKSTLTGLHALAGFVVYF